MSQSIRVGIGNKGEPILCSIHACPVNLYCVINNDKYATFSFVEKHIAKLIGSELLREFMPCNAESHTILGRRVLCQEINIRLQRLPVHIGSTRIFVIGAVIHGFKSHAFIKVNVLQSKRQPSDHAGRRIRTQIIIFLNFSRPTGYRFCPQVRIINSIIRIFLRIRTGSFDIQPHLI